MREDDLLKIFGNNLHNERLKKNISIKELSKITKIRESYLKKIELGEAKKISSKYIIVLSDALDIKPKELCKGI